MKKIFLYNEDSATIPFSKVQENSTIFAKDEHGELKGMIRKEKSGWILALGASSGATGWHETLRECLDSCVEFGYEFFT